MHDERKIYWEEYESQYYDWYGTHSYDDALAKLKYVLDFAGIVSGDSSVVKIEKILRFINDNIVYQPDMIDKFFAPIETLSYGSGDCNDFSILAAALFEVAGIDSAIGFYTDSTYVYGHAMALVHLDDLAQHGSYYFEDLVSKGLSPGIWTTIEPQSTIDNQDATSIGQWLLEVASET